MAKSVTIQRSEFETELQGLGKWTVVPNEYARETIYRLKPDSASTPVLIYSSIVGDSTRVTGEDAIRVVPIDTETNQPIRHAMKRIHRVEGWRKNLRKRINEAALTEIQRCNVCGSMMVPRVNSKTGGEFLGCVNFMNHPGYQGRRPNDQTTGSDVRRRETTSLVPPRVGPQQYGARQQPYPGSGLASRIRQDEAIKREHKVTVRLILGSKSKGTRDSGGFITRHVSAFKAAKFTDITEFNPIQTAILDVVGTDTNLVLASQTNTGKTKVAEMAIAIALKKGEGPAIYTSPLKALSQEKFDTWTDKKHPFGKTNISIVTGDYQLSDKRKKELAKADIIIMTSEMLDSRCRNIASEKSAFLEKAGVLVVDEMHLLGMPGRGDKLETGMVRFSHINQKARLVGLSATMPNVEELAGWMRTLNRKETILVASPWRAVPLEMNFRYYKQYRQYAESQQSLYNAVTSTMEEFPDDKVLVFVHSKAAGRALMAMFDDIDIKAEFHSADLDRGERTDIEKQFRQKDGDLRVVIATSTLAWGVNFPARRVIITGVHRGLSEVSELDILQMAGRAGRMGLDDRGDAYILLPDMEAEEHKERILNPAPITSGLQNPLILKFHVISEIANRECRTNADIQKWYKRTLAEYQGKALTEEELFEVINSLLEDHAIHRMPGTQGYQYVATELGKCANFFYMDPSNLWDYVRNFKTIFDHKEVTDVDIAWAMSNLRSYAQDIASKAEMYAVEPYQIEARDQGFSLAPPQMKVFVCYLKTLRGDMVDDKGRTIDQSMAPLMPIYRGLHGDALRLMQAIQYLDSRFAHFDRDAFWKSLSVRLRYDIPENLVPLCSIKGIGKQRALRLWEAGITTPDLFFKKRKTAAIAVGSASTYKNIVAANKEEEKDE